MEGKKEKELEKIKHKIIHLIEDKPDLIGKTENQIKILKKNYESRVRLLVSQKIVLKDYYDTLRLGRRRIFTTNPFILNRCRRKAESFKSFAHYLLVISNFGRFIKKDFDKAIKKDIEDYQVYLEEKGCSKRTIDDYSYIIKLFYIWLFKTEEVPAIVEDIQKPKHITAEIKAEEVLQPSEIKKLISKCDRIRDKALISLLFEAHCRVSELTNMSIKDFIPKEGYALVRVEGKTGKRDIAVVECMPYVERYLNDHPYRDELNAPLFYSVSKQNYGKQLSTKGVQSILKTISKRANLKKRCNPHWFRHSGLDWVARVHNYNERDLKLRGGWTKNSKMPDIYLHYGENEVNERYLNQKGINVKPAHLKEEKQLEAKICHRCGKTNEPDSRYCNCGCILDFEEALRIEKLKKESDVFADKIMRTPISNGIGSESGLYESIYQNMLRNPIMLEEFKKLIKKIKDEEENNK